jgi:hypothetical protein
LANKFIFSLVIFNNYIAARIRAARVGIALEYLVGSGIREIIQIFHDQVIQGVMDMSYPIEVLPSGALMKRF